MTDYRNEAEANFGIHAQRKLTEEELDRLNAIFHPPVKPAPRIPRQEHWNWPLLGALTMSIIISVFVIAILFNLLWGGA